ncbi:MAG: aliphatic sulfonate ABC transporter substrate-binding protein [Anaerostipes sp.]|nr:aliphatic sulfonate ABC transporter substrate-binding protein [Anaerostipes sp.]
MMRKNILKKGIVGVLVVAVMGTLFTGGKKSSSSSNSKKVDTVTIGTQEMPNDEGIAKAKDLFEKKMGVKIKIVKFDSGKDVNNALKAKSIDFGLQGSTSSALAVSTDIPIKVIWIHEVLGDIESLAVRKKDNVTSIKQLKGKKIAVPFATTSHYCLLRYLASQGLSEKDVTLLDMDTNSAYAAWKRGDIDAAWVWQPALQQILNDGGEILVSNGDAAKEGYMTANVEVVTEEFAKNHPDLVVKYIEALQEAQKIYNDDKEKTTSTLADFLGLKSADVTTQIKGATWPSAEEQLSADYLGTEDKKGALADNLLDTAKFLKDQKNITSVPDKSAFEDAIDSQFIQKANK